MKYIRTLNLNFNTEISEKEIPLFRGAVLHHLGEKADLLYHNHIGDNYLRYAYPLIQYKRIGGKAIIVSVDQGADLIGQLLWNLPEEIKLGDISYQLALKNVHPQKTLVQIWDTPIQYHINKWAPLSAENYRIYKTAENDDERRTLLERILKANILSMLKGLNIRLEEKLTVEITTLSRSYLVHYKNVELMAFNADFNCNLSLPSFIGLGKNASIGFGVLTKRTNQND